jgi:hypothetical protein
VSQESQPASLPLGQGSLVNIEDAIATFNAALLVENNSNDGDEGVNILLTILLSSTDQRLLEANIHKDKKVNKPMIIATLAFLTDKALSVKKEELKGINIEQLISLLLAIYKQICMPSCLDCQTIYQCHRVNDTVCCLNCEYTMCPSCFPHDAVPVTKPSSAGHYVVCALCVTEMKITHLNVSKEAANVVLTEATEENTQEDPPAGSPTQEPSVELIKKAVCSYFMRNQCRLGKSGDGCPFDYQPGG